MVAFCCVILGSEGNSCKTDMGYEVNGQKVTRQKVTGQKVTNLVGQKVTGHKVTICKLRYRLVT